MSERAAGEEIRGLGGAYVIERLRGSGGFGLTYAAVSRATGEPVIVKELRFERLRDWKSLELFEREGRVLSELRHPSIPAYKDFFAHDGARPFPVSEMSRYQGEGRLSVLLVQQLIDGPTLEERTRSGARLGAHEVEPLLRSLLETLAYLHELMPPVVHRDINPKNIVLGPQGRPYLVDFGAIQDRLRFESEVASTTVGTLGYMPLEQMRGGARPASDLYALGVTMLVTLSGRPPNELPVDDDSGKIRVSEVTSGLPAGVRRALDAMVEPILGKRVASARAALSLLEAPTPRGPAAPRPNPWGMAATMFGVIVVGGTALLMFRSEAPPALLSRGPSFASPPPDLPRTDTPPEPPPQDAELTWKAYVHESSGVPLSPGSACTVVASVHRGGGKTRIDHVVARCDDRVLYDSTLPLEGMSMNDSALGEVPEPGKAGVFRYKLSYSDVGTRTGARGQATLDSAEHTAVLSHETVPVYKVTLTLDTLSQIREGAPLLSSSKAAFDHVLQRRMMVLQADGPAPVKKGDRCELRVAPSYTDEHSCKVLLTCGSKVIFGEGTTGFEDCIIKDGEPASFTDDQPSSVDHDPRATLDVRNAFDMTVSDDLPSGTYLLHLTGLP